MNHSAEPWWSILLSDWLAAIILVSVGGLFIAIVRRRGTPAGGSPGDVERSRKAWLPGLKHRFAEESGSEQAANRFIGVLFVPTIFAVLPVFVVNGFRPARCRYGAACEVPMFPTHLKAYFLGAAALVTILVLKKISTYPIREKRLFLMLGMLACAMPVYLVLDIWPVFVNGYFDSSPGERLSVNIVSKQSSARAGYALAFTSWDQPNQLYDAFVDQATYEMARPNSSIATLHVKPGALGVRWLESLTLADVPR